DYVFTSGTLNFTPDAPTQTISVPVLASTADAPPLSFTVVLDSPVDARIDEAIGHGTIFNTPPTISIADTQASDGDSGTTAFDFAITLSRPSRRSISVQYATADGTAHAPADYVAVAPTTVTFDPNVTTQHVTVLVNGSMVSQPDKSFFVRLFNPVTGTIAR